MSRAAAVHIPRRHQSAPKEHEADREIKKAATEIHEGRYVPDGSVPEAALDRLGIALMAGTGQGVHSGDKPTLDEFQFTRDMNELSRHPRVVEALEKMQKEIDENPEDPHAVELSWAMHEALERQTYDQRWQGQQRWEGKENEEMRHGRILSPQQFYAELTEVIGRERVLMSDEAVLPYPDSRSGRVPLYVRNPEFKGVEQAVIRNAKTVSAENLRGAAEIELTKAKRLRLAHHSAEADRAFHRAGDMIQTATETLMERDFSQLTAPKQFLRVGVLQWPFGTEWMLMRFDEFGVPKTAKYLGWRTALLTMIRHRVITEAEAHKAFPVGSGPAANWYLQQLHTRRNKAKREAVN